MNLNGFVFDQMNHCHHNSVLSPEISYPGAMQTSTRDKTSFSNGQNLHKTRTTGKQHFLTEMAYSILLLSFFLCLCPTFAIPSAEPSLLQQQQQGGLLPFPEGRGPDGTLYKTDYRCEGENMTITCEDSDGPGVHGIITVVRANFGRFSIAICNRHGQTDWSVNCMAPQTTKILQQKCDGQQSCLVSVDSSVFHDACPGTFKYLEAHYACTSSQPQPQTPDNSGSKRGPPLPPWLFDGKHGGGNKGPVGSTTVSTNHRKPWANRDHHKDVAEGMKSSVNGGSRTTTIPPKASDNTKDLDGDGKKEERRKPILVTEKMEQPTDFSATTTETTPRRVPITTPKPTSTSSTTASVDKSTEASTTEVGPAAKKSVFNSENYDNYDSSSPITTFTISSKYDQEQFETKTFSDLESSDISFNTPSITTSCPPVTSRKLQWDWTPIGKIAIQQCPIGTTGLAKWNCVDSSTESESGIPVDPESGLQVNPQWSGSQPDMSDCKSVAMSNLDAQVRKKDPENVLISSLSYVTRTKELYGGDLESAVATIRTVSSRVQYRLQSTAVFHNKESHVRQILQNVLQSASNILEKSNRRAWLDLRPERRMKLATSLLLALEESAFLLAGVLNEPTHILETYEILTMAITAVDSEILSEDSDEAKLAFPSKRLLYVDDSLELHKSDVTVYGQEGIAEVIFFSYTTLHEILEAGKLNFGGKVPVGDWRLNSRIVSASLGRGRHVELAHPVLINLRHLMTENMTNPVCVYWDYETHGWSDEGCDVISSNATQTVCRCNHLTNFAVVMKAMHPGVTKDLMTAVRLDIVAYIIASVIAVAMVILMIKFRKRFLECFVARNLFCCCGCCKESKQSHLEKKCQSFYAGFSRQNTGVMGSSGLQCSTPNTSKNRFFTGPNRAHSQYVLANQQLHHGMHSNTLATSATSTSLLTQPLMSSHQQQGSRAHITLNPYSTQLVENINMMMPDKSSSSSNTNSSSSTTSTTLGRHHQSCPMSMNPHLMTLTSNLRRDSNVQIENGQVMNVDAVVTSAQGLNGDLVYRAVSPHGHVYWEIDPSQVYGTNNNRIANNEENVALLLHHQPVISPSGYQGQQQIYNEEEQSLLLHHHNYHQNHPGNELRPLLMNPPFQHFPSMDDLNSDQMAPHVGRVMTASSSSNNLLRDTPVNSFLENGTSRQSTFVRTGANRFRHANTQQHSKRLTSADRNQQQGVSSVSASIMAQQQGMVPEQLQTQVQIKDIKPIQVSVKSSEYIEAKIRTLRKNAK